MEKSELIIIAQELNKVMGLKPKIDISLDICNLQVVICRAAALVQPADKFSNITVNHLYQLARMSSNNYSPDFCIIAKQKVPVINDMFQKSKKIVDREKKRVIRSNKYKKTRAKNLKQQNKTEKLSSRHYINRIHELISEEVYNKNEIFSIITFEFPKEKHEGVLKNIDRLMEEQ